MLPKLSQEEFDEAVKTNIEDFDMEPEEAVSSAVEEFKLQGYNLEGIIKSSSGGNTDSHPVAVATRDLAAASAGAGAGVDSAATLQQRLSALQQQFRGLNSSDMQQALAVANKEGTVAALLATAKAASSLLSSSSSTDATPSTSAEGVIASLLIPSLRTLRVLMQLPDCRASFLGGGGPELLLQLLQDSCCGALNKQQQQQQSDDSEQQQQYYQLAAAVAGLAEAASWQDEEGKCIFMQDGFAAAALSLLQHIGATSAVQHSTPAVATAATSAGAAAAGALRAFTTADDARPPASKAFSHARQLAGKPHNALAVLLPVLQQLQDVKGGGLPVGPLMAVMSAVRQIAANDEICKAFAEAGGVSALQQLLTTAATATTTDSSATNGPSPELVRGAAAALRQLANSDSIKAQLAEQGVLPVLLRSVRVYGPSQPGVQEALLGLLVAMVLRMPDISTAAAEAGAVEVLTEVLAAAPAMAAAAAKSKAAAAAGTVAANGSSPSEAAATVAANGSKDTAAADQDVDELASRVFGVGISSGSNGGGSVAAVQRQACMAVRNMVVRNPELRPGFLAAGAEGLLRSVKGLFPAACKDVGAAALRDLGLDNYNQD